MNYKIRSLLPKPVKNLLRELSYLSVFSDLDSLVRYWKVIHRSIEWGPSSDTVELRIRKLGGQAITIRTKGSDSRVVFVVFFHEFHLPSKGAVRCRNAALIFDLGANIGLTMAHFAYLYPEATIVGVELDRENAEYCAKNVSPWGERCKVIQAAVWPVDGEVSYEYDERCQYGLSVKAEQPVTTFNTKTSKALSMNSLISLYADRKIIDYVKMDIEGAERDVLRYNTEWTTRVNCIKVELHGQYTKEECIADLSALGFEAWTDNNYAYCVVGVKKGEPNIMANSL